jgi:hypothetical protein
MVERQLPKLIVRVRFPSPAPSLKPQVKRLFRSPGLTGPRSAVTVRAINGHGGIQLTGLSWGPVGDLQPRAGVHYPRSTGEFQSWFATDADCLDFLDWLRWPGGFVCPKCRR